MNVLRKPSLSSSLVKLAVETSWSLRHASGESSIGPKLLAWGHGAGPGASPGPAGGGRGGARGRAERGDRTRARCRVRGRGRGGGGRGLRASGGADAARRGPGLRGRRGGGRRRARAVAAAERGAGLVPVPHAGGDRLARAQLDEGDGDQGRDEHHGRGGHGDDPARPPGQELRAASWLAVPPVAGA